MKEDGASQSETYELLESLRLDLKSETEEDALLDVMDIVVGHCSKDARVWQD